MSIKSIEELRNIFLEFNKKLLNVFVKRRKREKMSSVKFGFATLGTTANTK